MYKLDNLILVEHIDGVWGSKVKYNINDFDFGCVLVATADSRGSSHCVMFTNYSENFFFYGYGSSSPTRCNLRVDTSTKEISVYTSYYTSSPEEVSNLVMWKDLFLYKISK